MAYFYQGAKILKDLTLCQYKILSFCNAKYLPIIFQNELYADKKIKLPLYRV